MSMPDIKTIKAIWIATMNNSNNNNDDDNNCASDDHSFNDDSDECSTKNIL